MQIQNLNQLFQQNNGGNPGGNIYVVLMQPIPKDHEVVLSASNTFGDGAAKDIGLSLSMTNPVAVIQWPLPHIDKAATFRIHAQLRHSQALPKPIKHGIANLLNELGHNEEQKSSQMMDINNFRGRSGNQVAMMIFSGKRPNNNGNRLSWVNVQLSAQLTFGGMVDCACAQLGLDPPGHSVAVNGGGFGFGAVRQQRVTIYVVRNQMGHRCDDKEVVLKYLQRMAKEQNSNLFPVFVFNTRPMNNHDVQAPNAAQPQGHPAPFNFGGFGGFGAQ